MLYTCNFAVYFAGSLLFDHIFSIKCLRCLYVQCKKKEDNMTTNTKNKQLNICFIVIDPLSCLSKVIIMYFYHFPILQQQNNGKDRVCA